MENWWKYTYVCSICDALIEITNKSNIYKPHICCNIEATWLSVVDATIKPITEKKEETKMETLTPAPQTMTLTWLENDAEVTKVYTESEVRSMAYNNKNLNSKMSEYYRKESQLRNLLEEVYVDSSEQDTLAQIANIFDVPLTKTIDVTAYVRVSLSIEVDLAEGDYDLEDMVSNNLTVDSYGGEITVNDYDVTNVEEGLY